MPIDIGITTCVREITGDLAAATTAGGDLGSEILTTLSVLGSDRQDHPSSPVTSLSDRYGRHSVRWQLSLECV